MNFFTVNQDKCKRDGLCVAECPMRLIELKDGLPVPSGEDAGERCVQCGHCVAVCPHGAFSLNEMQAEDCPPVRRDWALDPDRAEHFIRARRSIRLYQDRAVEQDHLQRLIEIARYSPTGMNSQQVKWLVLSGKEKVRRVAELVADLFNIMIRAQQPMAVNYRLDRIVEALGEGHDYICRGAPALVFAYAPKEYPIAAVDCTSALAYFDLAAPCLGLGACWAGFVMLAIAQYQPLRQFLDLPEDHACFGGMMVGYPKYAYHRLPLRKEPQIIWR